MAGKIWTVSQMKSGFYKAGKACSDPSDCLPAFMCARGAARHPHLTAPGSTDEARRGRRKAERARPWRVVGLASAGIRWGPDPPSPVLRWGWGSPPHTAVMS